MKKFVFVLFIFLLMMGQASASVIDDVLEKAKEVGYYKGNTDVLVMTNLGYSKGSEVYMNEFFEKSGVKFDKNIVFVHSPYYKPLWFAFFNRTTGDCMYVEVKDGRIVRTSKENIEANRLMSNPEDWDKKMRRKVFDGNEFSIITIANVWAKGCPYDLLRCAEFHNHICPGLVSGYLIVKFLEKELPLKRGEYYQILAVPPWCKDDCFQVLFDSTVGKRRMYAKALSEDQIDLLPKEYKNIAGIYVAWNRSAGKGRAVILTFDWNKACEMAGVNRSDFKKFNTYHWWLARLKLDLFMMNYLDKPETFVSKVKEFEIDSKTLNKLNTAGVNPLVELRLIETENAETKENKKLPTSIEVAVVGIAMAVVLKRKLYRNK